MKNKFEIDGDVTVIFLERRDGSKFGCLIDTEDLSRAQEFSGSWAYARVYKDIVYTQGTISGTTVKMHRWLLKPPKHLYIDHINHNGLDNRRENLRTATNAENQQNRENLPGICYLPNRLSPKKWNARVRTGRKTLFAKYFLTREEAVDAVIKARAELFPYSKEARTS